MDKPIIEVHNRSKLYRLGALGASAIRESGEPDYFQQASVLDLEPEDFAGSGKLPTRDCGLCLLMNKWSAANPA